MTPVLKETVNNIMDKAQGLMTEGGVIGLCEHTDDVCLNDIYIARGKGVTYIDQAFERGAILAVCEVGMCHLAEHKNIVAVDDFDRVVQALVNAVYAEDVAGVELVGITGTNGKTSVANIIGDMLNRLGARSGYIGTLGYGVVGEVLTKGRNTTPDVVTLYRNIAGLARAGCRYIALEVSSHGIALQRIRGLGFTVGVFINLSRDHLDFHQTMENYRAVKASFFSEYVMNGLVVNIDDELGDDIYQAWVHEEKGLVIAISTENKPGYNTLYTYAGCIEAGQSRLQITQGQDSVSSITSLVGQFNYQNVMLAYAVCVQLGFSMDSVLAVLPELGVVPGRVERHVSLHGASVYIDYAHTPAGVEAVLADETLRSDINYVVLGCGGDRDQGKRPLMADMASRYSDKVILCDDNVRNDSATDIILNMLSGIEDKRHAVICRDRRQAIEYAITSAGEDSSVFLLGKGDESIIQYGAVSVEQSDRQVVQALQEAA